MLLFTSMAAQPERILIVENDPAVGDLIARQALQPQGYETRIVTQAADAIQQAATYVPDVVIANLFLPGLSGKDLMAALTAQSIDIPVIMIAPEGKELDVIRAFRLGASDYVTRPMREAEVVSAVERALKQVRARRERQRLSDQLARSNKQLEKRVNELTTIYAVGKAVTSITDQQDLFSKIVDGAISITGADIGWLLTKDERSDDFLLRAQKGLPPSLAANLNKAWDDGISSLVALSGEALSIHGVALERFKIAVLGRAALVTPVKVGKEIVALMVVMRKAEQEFSTSDQAMLDAVSDYASISMVNARLFRALDERAASLQATVDKAQEGERVKDEIIQRLSGELNKPLEAARLQLQNVLDGDTGEIAVDQIERLGIAAEKLQHMEQIVDSMVAMYENSQPKQTTKINLNDLANQAVGRFDTVAQQNQVTLNAEISQDALYALADRQQINAVFDALLSNAIKFSPHADKVTVTVQRGRNGHNQVSVHDNGVGIGKKHQNHIFEPMYKISENNIEGLGMGLALVKNIVNAHGGEVWVDSKLEAGSTFHFTLPTA